MCLSLVDKSQSSCDDQNHLKVTSSFQGRHIHTTVHDSHSHLPAVNQLTCISLNCGKKLQAHMQTQENMHTPCRKTPGPPRWQRQPLYHPVAYRCCQCCISYCIWNSIIVKMYVMMADYSDVQRIWGAASAYLHWPFFNFTRSLQSLRGGGRECGCCC